MIRASFPSQSFTVEAGDGQRTIRGVACPWNATGVVADGRKVRFLPGSLDASARPVVLRDHDRTRPIGRVAESTASNSGLAVNVRVSATRDGDEALILAGDGVLGSFSVGADPTRYRMDGDVLVVEKAEWQELSLLTFGAFADARVVDVAASGQEDPEPEPQPEPEPPAEPEPEPEEEEEPPVEATLINAGAPAVIPLTTRPARPDLTLDGVARLIASGAKAAEIQAQLVNVTTTEIDDLVRPAFLTEILGLITFGRPTINAINNAPLPPSGMRVEWPVWGSLPVVDVVDDEKVLIPTGVVGFTTAGVDIETFAGGNDISIQAAQRSNPSFVGEYIRAITEVYNRRTNGYVLTGLLAAATAVPPAATLLDTFEALVSSFNPLTTPGGGLFIGMSWDVGATMIGTTSQNGPAYWDASINFSSIPTTQSASGITIYTDRQLPAKTIIAGFRSSATWYEDPAAPVELRVVDVSLLGIDIGVYGFAALAVTDPGSLRKVTFTTLPAAAASE